MNEKKTLNIRKKSVKIVSVCFKTKEEINEGKLGKPVPISEIDLESCMAAIRFGVDQPDGTGGNKTRRWRLSAE